jgi:hypothetical protein
MSDRQRTIEEMSIFSNSSHLEWRAGQSDKILKGTLKEKFKLIVTYTKAAMDN